MELHYTQSIMDVRVHSLHEVDRMKRCRVTDIWNFQCV